MISPAKKEKMGQREVYELLSKEPDRWFSCRELSTRLGVTEGSINVNLRRLGKFNQVSVIISEYSNNGRRGYLYKIKKKKKGGC